MEDRTRLFFHSVYRMVVADLAKQGASLAIPASMKRGFKFVSLSHCVGDCRIIDYCLKLMPQDSNWYEHQVFYLNSLIPGISDSHVWIILLNYIVYDWKQTHCQWKCMITLSCTSFYMRCNALITLINCHNIQNRNAHISVLDQWCIVGYGTCMCIVGFVRLVYCIPLFLFYVDAIT